MSRRPEWKHWTRHWSVLIAIAIFAFVAIWLAPTLSEIIKEWAGQRP